MTRFEVCAALLLTACHKGSPPQPSPTRDILSEIAPPDIDQPPTADAPMTGTVTLREVTRGPKATAPIHPEKLALAVRETIIDTVYDKVYEAQPLPAWLPDHARQGEKVWGTSTAEDGRVLALSGHTIMMFDASHHFETGLDFEPLRGDLVRKVQLCCDHATIDRGTVVTQPTRIGDVLVVVASDMARGDMKTLEAVDIASATTLWKTVHDMVPESYVVIGGNAITSTHESGRWTLDVIALDTGAVVARVPTKYGPYGMGSKEPDGSLHAVTSGTGLEGKSSAIDISVTAQMK